MHTITADMVNDFWDDYFDGAERVGEPTWALNCHGYSTGLGYWVQRSGYATVLKYDWQKCASMNDVDADCTYWKSSDHSVRIDDVETVAESYRTVTKTSEKMAYAGTYEKVYLLPGGATINAGEVYKQNIVRNSGIVSP
jgi:hypothetical protein